MDPVQKFAPLMFFDRDERHLPGEPDAFRAKSRFEESNFDGARDRSWNPASGRWEVPASPSAHSLGADWGTIVSTIRAEMPQADPALPPDRVTRPRDDRNAWGRGDARGFLLELDEGFGRDRSGSDPRRPVPIFHDRYPLDCGGVSWTVLSYWFFYVYNWNVFFAHEGDWEHVSLYFEPAALEHGDMPEYVYYACHNDGHLLAPADVAWEEDTHPHVYVSPWGHPSYPTVAAVLRPRYTVRWRTWEQPIPAVSEQPWAAYDGAWGEVGITVHSTGPLGPLFKRGRDKVTLRR